jgi:hypothetical protein
MKITQHGIVLAALIIAGAVGLTASFFYKPAAPAPTAPACQLREFTPQKDITAYELAFIYKNTNGYTHQALCIDDKTLAEINAQVRRHFTTVPPAPVR